MAKSSKKAKRLMLICNPQAGDPADPTGRIDKVVRLLADQGFEVHLAVEKPKKRAELIARKAVRKGYRLVVVMGGDGTIEAAMHALVNTKTRLGILMGGTENNVARTLGIPEDFESACRLIACGNCRKLDVGLIKTKKKRAYFFEFAASGILADLFPMAQDLYKRHWRSLDDAVGELIQYQVPRMELTLDGRDPIVADSSLVVVSNTPAFGLQYEVAPDASVEDGLLDVSFYPNMSKVGILTYFQSISRGRETGQPKIERYQVRKIKVKAQPRQDVVADGVALGKGRIKIRVLPGALRVLVP